MSRHLIPLITTFVLSLSISFSFAQSLETKIHQLLADRGELVLSFDHPGEKALSSLSQFISIDKIEGDKVVAYANKTGFEFFEQFGLDFQLLTPPSLVQEVVMKDVNDIVGKEINDWDFYPTYEAYVEMMDQFAEDYPEICTVISIGESIDGRDILIAKISDNISVSEDEAQFLYTSSIHGDETTGFVLTLRLIDYLLSNYGTDPEVNNLVDNLEIWINPLANPDGTYYTGNSSVNGAIRFNANGVDLNRNFPDPEDGPNPDGNEWQTETILFMELAEENDFLMSANFHGGTEVCNYPWDTWSQYHADDDWWQYVCGQYADTVHLFAPSNYMTGYNNGITNGYEWYEVAGGRQDYMTYFHQCREFTLEISDTKLLPASDLPDHWDYNYRSMLNYMKQALFGLTGAVTDGETGDPIMAEVYIEDHDMDSSWVYTLESSGTYFRPLFEGSYSITFSAPGYFSQTIEGVSVLNEELTILDVELEAGDLIADFEASETSISIGNVVNFTDDTYGNPVSWEWTFEGGDPATSLDQHPENILYESVGSYDVSLTVSDGTNSITIVKEDFISVNEMFFMDNTSVTTCSGTFLDSGGLEGNYDDQENFIMVFLPGDPLGKISLDFLEFYVEYHADCNYDWLKVYDGDDIYAPLVGLYCGTNSPGIVTATNDLGALTIEFHSDISETEAGWEASISCEGIASLPVAEFDANTTEISAGGEVSFYDMSLNEPLSWSWIFEGGFPASSDETNPQVTYSEEGVYNVTLTVTNEEGSNTIVKEDYINVLPFTGIKRNNKDPILVYPNPAADQITVKVSEQIDFLQLHTLAGNKVFESNIKGLEFIIPVHNLESGLYILTTQTASEVSHVKVEVRH